MRKTRSIRKMLVVPSSFSFALLVVMMVLTASILYGSNITSHSDAQMLATSEQVLANYDTYFKSVLITSSEIASRYESAPLSDRESAFQSYFDTVMSLKSEILDMSLYSATDGSVIAHNTASEPSGASLTDDQWFLSAKDNQQINVFSHLEKTSEDYRFGLSKYLAYAPDSSFDAVVKVDFDFTAIVNIIPESTLGVGGRFILYDKDYNLVYSPNNDETEALGYVQKLVIGSSNAVKLNGHAYYLYATTVANTTWRLAIFQNRDSVVSALTSFSVVISCVGLGVVVSYSFILLGTVNRISKPIEGLSQEMAMIESLNYKATLHSEIKGSSEVVELNRSFNQMMSRMGELTDDLVSEKEEQRKSELKALQNQINPHFLYNTLDSIIALVDKGENVKAEAMIVALSKFFRLSISSGHNVIPLLNEIEHARNYLLIQKMRFGDSFAFEINVAPGLEKYFVVKLILQPIVENSIGHGLKEGETGIIKIKADEEGDYLRFLIEDNGYGMTPAKVEELRRSLSDETVYKGVGLKNVFQRIRIYYGPLADVQVESEEDVGTKVTILIPKKEALHGEE